MGQSPNGSPARVRISRLPVGRPHRHPPVWVIRNAAASVPYIEVASRKAQVVIANPAGITCEGCGFSQSEHE
ncbi:hypothetical protein [Yersinia rohdei]|uniref:hypothetical protein n=1 Tax=Yersinia rohdei TaxID=29485 RepID=UPI0012E20621|nr:hypothetical protein [Yersinia rohdei]